MVGDATSPAAARPLGLGNPSIAPVRCHVCVTCVSMRLCTVLLSRRPAQSALYCCSATVLTRTVLLYRPCSPQLLSQADLNAASSGGGVRIAAMAAGYLVPPPKELVRAPRKQVGAAAVWWVLVWLGGAVVAVWWVLPWLGGAVIACWWALWFHGCWGWSGGCWWGLGHAVHLAFSNFRLPVLAGPTALLCR